MPNQHLVRAWSVYDTFIFQFWIWADARLHDESENSAGYH